MKPQINKVKAAAVIAALLMSGCDFSDTNEPYSAEYIAMDTLVSSTIYGENAESVSEAVKNEVLHLEDLFSVTDEKSDIYSLNNAGGEAVEVDPETFKLLQFSLEMCEKTEGALDITLYPVVREWGFTTGDYKIPDDEALSALLKNVDYRRVSLENNNTVTIPEAARLDLGAVAKGYAGDRVIEIMKEHNITSGLISLGGNIQALGGKPDGTDWRVGVQNPFSYGYVCTLNIRDKAVVTSGNYERYFEEDGRRYWHIIDPSDGKPARSGIVSATIISDSGAYSDALSTAVFVMGKEKALQLQERLGNFEMILVMENKEVYYSEGAKEMIADR